jgi:hypothetical protein
VARVSDRLRYITRIIREQGERDVISLRRDDVVWLIGTVVQLRDDNEYHEKRMKMYEKRAVHLATVNDQLKDDNNTNQALLDKLYLIAPDKIEEVIDAQKESDKQ